MSFDSLAAVEEFYKTYAHEAGFAVRIGPQIKVLDRVENKRFYCTRQGFMRKKVTLLPPENRESQRCNRRQDVAVMHIYM